MTADTRPIITHARIAFFAMAVAAAIAMLASVFPAPQAIALGVLGAWLFCLSVTVGASVWLLIGALTGGRWLTAARPGLIALARMTWVVALVGLMFALAGSVLYPWWASGNGAEHTIWLNPAFFMVRTGLVLVLWSVFGLSSGRQLSPLTASLMLVGHGIAVSVSGVDWVLSLEPGFASTAFGAHFAVLQLALALAAVAVMRPAEHGEDIGALLLACVLGVFYLAAMEFVVSWSGNLPGKAAWYLARQGGFGRALLWFSFGLGFLVPFCVLLVTSARSNAAMLRHVGTMMLAGGLAHLIWLIGADGFVALIATGLVATVASTLALSRRVTNDG